MGKNSKLRCFLGKRRNKRSSQPIEEKLSLPKLLQKCPAPPNQYFRSGRDQDVIVMGADAKFGKLGIIEADNTITPLKMKDIVILNEDVQLDSRNEIADRGMGNFRGRDLNSESGCNVEEGERERSIRPEDVEILMLRNSIEKVKSPTDGNSKRLSSMDENSLEFSRESGREIKPSFQKEFPPSRLNSKNKIAGCNVHSYNEFQLNAQEPKSSNTRMDDSSFSSNNSSSSVEWNASGACRVTASSYTMDSGLTTSNMSDRTCPQCFPANDVVKDCDWGWFCDESKLSKYPSNIPADSHCLQPTSSSTAFERLPAVACGHAVHSYVNERCVSSRSFPESHSSTCSHIASHANQQASGGIAFTISEVNGRRIQVSITHSQPMCSCLDFSYECEQHHMTSNLRHATSEDRFSIDPSESCSGIGFRSTSSPQMAKDINRAPAEGHRIDKCSLTQDASIKSEGKVFPMSCSTMTPNLSSQRRESKKSTMREGKVMRDEQESHPRGRCHEHFSDFAGSKPHNRDDKNKNPIMFNLSIESYSKVKAYCDTNKRGDQGQTQGHVPPYSKRKSILPDLSTLHGVHCPEKISPSTQRHSGMTNAVDTNRAEFDDFLRLAKVLETVEECNWYWGAMSGQESRAVLRNASAGTFLLRDSSDPRYLFSLSVKTRQGPTSIRIVYSDGSFRFDSEMDDANARRQSSHSNQNDSTRQGHRSSHQSGSSSRHSDHHPNYVKRLTPVFTSVIHMILFYTKQLELSSPRTKDSVTSQSCDKRSKGMSSSADDRPSSAPASSGSKTRDKLSDQFMCYWVNRNGRQEIPIMLSKPKTRGFPSLQQLCRQTLSTSQNLWANEQIIDQFPLPNSLKKYIKKYPYPI